MSRKPPGRKRVRTPEQRAAAAARAKTLRESRKAAGLKGDGSLRQPRKQGQTSDERRAAQAESVKALRERRKAAGQKQDGKPRQPRQPRTKKGA